MSIALMFAGAIALLFAGAQLARAVGLGRYKTPSIVDLQAGELVRVSGIAREHEPAVPSPLEANDRVLWCHAYVKKSPSLGTRGPPRTETRKAATRFRLVDEREPEAHVLIDGERLNPHMVSLDPEPEEIGDDDPAARQQVNPLMVLFDTFIDIAVRLHAANVKVIRPGDRLWITARARETEDGLVIGRNAQVDNVSPEVRIARDRIGARGLATIGGPLLGLGLLLRLFGL